MHTVMCSGAFLRIILSLVLELIVKDVYKTFCALTLILTCPQSLGVTWFIITVCQIQRRMDWIMDSKGLCSMTTVVLLLEMVITTALLMLV